MCLSYQLPITNCSSIWSKETNIISSSVITYNMLIFICKAFIFLAVLNIFPTRLTIETYENVYCDGTGNLTSPLPQSIDKVVQKNECLYQLVIKPRVLQQSNQRTKSLLLYLTMILLANANDVHLNPGPNSTTIFPCGTCDLPVTWEDRGIVCDTCNQWYHANCQSVQTKTYNDLVNDSAIVWDCIVCDCPN